jgi:hypothetical protein
VQKLIAYSTNSTLYYQIEPAEDEFKCAGGFTEPADPEWAAWKDILYDARQFGIKTLGTIKTFWTFGATMPFTAPYACYKLVSESNCGLTDKCDWDEDLGCVLAEDGLAKNPEDAYVADITSRYKSCFGVHGLMLEEAPVNMVPGSTAFDWYRTLYVHARDEIFQDSSGRSVWLWPKHRNEVVDGGVKYQESIQLDDGEKIWQLQRGYGEHYLNVTDVLVLFNVNYYMFRNVVVEGWVFNYPASRFACIVEGTPHDVDVQEIIEWLISRANCGFQYVLRTGDDPRTGVSSATNEVVNSVWRQPRIKMAGLVSPVPLGALVPMYQWPTPEVLETRWRPLLELSSFVTQFVIFNPNSGDPRSADELVDYDGSKNSDWADARALVAEYGSRDGARVRGAGYVATLWGDGDLDVVRDAIRIYLEEWQMDAIFLDEVLADDVHIGIYQSLYSYIKVLGSNLVEEYEWAKAKADKNTNYPFVIFDLGIASELNPSYVTVADLFVTYEDDASKFSSWQPQGWQFNFPASKWGGMFKQVDETQIGQKASQIIEEAISKNLGWMWLSPDRTRQNASMHTTTVTSLLAYPKALFPGETYARTKLTAECSSGFSERGPYHTIRDAGGDCVCPIGYDGTVQYDPEILEWMEPDCVPIDCPMDWIATELSADGTECFCQVGWEPDYETCPPYFLSDAGACRIGSFDFGIESGLGRGWIGECKSMDQARGAPPEEGEDEGIDAEMATAIGAGTVGGIVGLFAIVSGLGYWAKKQAKNKGLKRQVTVGNLIDVKGSMATEEEEEAVEEHVAEFVALPDLSRQTQMNAWGDDLAAEAVEAAAAMGVQLGVQKKKKRGRAKKVEPKPPDTNRATPVPTAMPAFVQHTEPGIPPSTPEGSDKGDASPPPGAEAFMSPSPEAEAFMSLNHIPVAPDAGALQNFGRPTSSIIESSLDRSSSRGSFEGRRSREPMSPFERRASRGSVSSIELREDGFDASGQDSADTRRESTLDSVRSEMAFERNGKGSLAEASRNKGDKSSVYTDSDADIELAELTDLALELEDFDGLSRIDTSSSYQGSLGRGGSNGSYFGSFGSYGKRNTDLSRNGTGGSLGRNGTGGSLGRNGTGSSLTTIRLLDDSEV